MSVSRYDFGSLLFNATRDFNRLERNFCKMAGLYQGQPRILTILKANEGVTLSELAPLCTIGLPSLSVSLRNLQKAGMIRKAGAGKNQRLYLTEQGNQRALEFHQALDCFFTQYFSGLEPQEIQHFYALLQGFDDYVRTFNDNYELQHGWKKA